MELMKKPLLLRFFLVAVLLIFVSIGLQAQWEGPTTILGPLEIGDGPMQLGVEEVDEDSLGPTCFSVDNQGNIVIADNVNDRILIFRPDGSVLNTISCPEISGDCYSWPSEIIVSPNSQRILVLDELCTYDYQGNIHKCCDITFGPHGEILLYGVSDGFILNQGDDYWSVDLEGNRVGKLPERPLELGRFETENGEKYLKFPSVTIPADHLYQYADYRVLPDQNLLSLRTEELFSKDGVKIGFFSWPPPPPAGTENSSYVLEYIDNSGNIYGMLDNNGELSIAKWTYVGPEAAAKSKSSTAPESKSPAKPAPSVKPSTKAGTGDVKQPAEQKPEATAKPPAKEGKKATPEVVQKEQKKDEGK